jgi:hypothetical protein
MARQVKRWPAKIQPPENFFNQKRTQIGAIFWQPVGKFFLVGDKGTSLKFLGFERLVSGSLRRLPRNFQ